MNEKSILLSKNDKTPRVYPPQGVANFGVELVSSDAGDLWVPLEDEVMREHLRHAGSWELNLGRLILALMPKQGGVFLDVGANIGYFSCLVARHVKDCQIIAFEPHPLIYPLLRLNVWQSRVRIETWPCALGASTGVVALTTSIHNLGDTKTEAAANHQIANCIAPVARLDELIPDLEVDLVKIDVQGGELAVLEGMSGVLLRSPHIRIVMEFSPDLLLAKNLEPIRTLRTIRGMGFDIALLRDDDVFSATDVEIVNFCRSAGLSGQANILLYAAGGAARPAKVD